MIKALPKLAEALGSFDDEFIEQAAIQVKYDVYIEKEKELVVIGENSYNLCDGGNGGFGSTGKSS